MSLINLIVLATNAWISWQHGRRAHDELMALDNRLLADIGLRRTDIAAIFHDRMRGMSVGIEGAPMALGALLAKPVFRHLALPPVWPF